MRAMTTVYYNSKTGILRLTPPKRMTSKFAVVEMDEVAARQVVKDHRNERDRERYRRELAESGTVRWHWTPDPDAKAGCYEGPRFRFTEFLGADLISEGPAALEVGANGHARCASCGELLSDESGYSVRLGEGQYCLPCDKSGKRYRPGEKKPPEPKPRDPDGLKGGKG